ncbi:MAG: hypothetical protein ABII13_03725 [Patescibacteria group bacterium]
MAKLSRKQRKVAKTIRRPLSKRKPRMVQSAGRRVRRSVQTHQQTEGEPLTDAAAQDQDLEAEQASGDEVPEPPESHVRVLDHSHNTDCCEICGRQDDGQDLPVQKTRPHLARQALIMAQRMDDRRAFDLRIRNLLTRRYITAEAVESLRYMHRLSELSSGRNHHWSHYSIAELQHLAGILLFHKSGNPTEFGEQLWELFKLRIRRKGALDYILNPARVRAATKAA